jgi:trk system potassium uptake protein TrkH
LATTLIFEMTGVLLMFSVFARDYGVLKGLWLAIFHSVSAWNNAGFSLFKDNLISYQSSWVVNLTITGLIIFGGIGYQVIMEIYFWILHKLKRNGKKFCFSLNFKVVIHTTILLLIFGTLWFLIVETYNTETFANLTIKDKILASWFQSVTSRTAGFNTIDIGKMSVEGLLMTMVLMFIGASPSGTGGGIKTTTLRIIANCTRSVLRGHEEVVLYQRQVPTPLILKAITVVFGSAIAIAIATLGISLLESEFTSLSVLFEVVSAFGTVGLSMGITSSLSPLSQMILVLTMYTGRIGVILLMAAFVGDPRPSNINYPEENLLVG